MAGEEAGGTGPEGGAPKPDAKPSGSGSEGTPGSDPKGQGGAEEKRAIPVDSLPEDMRDKSPAEINRMWQTAAAVLAAKNDEVEQLNTRLRALEEAKTKEPPEPDPTEGVDLKEMIYDDPEKAVEIAFQRVYGKEFQRVESAVSDTVLMKVAKEIGPDFDKHEDKIRAILAGSKGPVTPDTVHGAYLMAKGLSTVEYEREARKKAAESEPPTPEVKDSDLPQLTDLDKQIARGMGMSEEEYIKYSGEYIEVEVPGV